MGHRDVRAPMLDLVGTLRAFRRGQGGLLIGLVKFDVEIMLV